MRLFLILIFLVIVPTIQQSVSAQGITGYDLVDAVNALRSSLGLEPYQIDGDIMAYAQEHSDYQAANQNSTHLHRDGLLPQSHGLQENVAVLDKAVASVNIVVYEIWVDWGHRHIMTDYSSGWIGGGVAQSKDGQYYFTINIRPGEETISNTPSSGTVIAQQDTPIPISPLVTSQPREDGAIIHKVGYGQSLWSIAIAYGVKINDIRRLNNIADDSTSIYPNQELLIGYASTSTPEPTETPSINIQTPTESPAQLSATSTKMPIAEQSLPAVETTAENPIEIPVNRTRSWAFFLAMGMLGLAVLSIWGYWRSTRVR
ncbi:MAG: LysM peptidoglycan-binding domain-containing protein [Anaerolineales bacterium]|nr:LysM peptidoglycan-binding domain-containing protein [Anaerolineales bacterium]